MKAEAEYIADELVDKELDREIRRLLTTCFTKREDVVFKHRRYFVEPYPHRWVIRGPRRELVAHIGMHEKHVEARGEIYRVGGMAEVCVHPDWRGRRYVPRMLQQAHAWLSRHDFAFALLFGDPRVYGSSGYVEVRNLSYGGGEEGWKTVPAMICELSHIPWPNGEVHLPGPKF